MTVLQIEKELRHKIENFKKEKQERLKILKDLKDEEQVLCDALFMTPSFIPSGTVPSGETLETLRKRIAKLSADKVSYSKCPKISYTKFDKMAYAKSAYPDQTAPSGGVW